MVVTGDPESNRTEQADRVAAWLHGRSRDPLLVVIDDLHWADAATLSVWTGVASVLATMPLVVIGAYSAAAAPMSPPCTPPESP